MTDHPKTEQDHAYLHAHGIAHTHGHVHENQKAVVNRLARAIGHLERSSEWWKRVMTAPRF